MTTTVSTTTRRAHRPAFTDVRRTALRTSVAAVGLNLTVFGIARGAGVDFVAGESSRSTIEVTGGAVLAATLVAMVVGWSLVALAVRRQGPRLRTMAIVGAGVAVVSTALPATLNVAVSARLLLAALHLIAGTFFVLGVARSSATNDRGTA